MPDALTRKGAATRHRIVEGAAAEIRRHGVATTTLDDVLARTSTSKGQLFHYFPGGREELLLAVARFEAELVLTDQRPELDELTSWASWWAWRNKLVARYRAQGQDCPLNMLTTQIGRDSPGSRAVIEQLMRHWQNAIAAGVRHLQEAGQTDATLDADHTAAAILAGIQGGVLLLLATGRTDHLEAALDLVFARLGAPPN